MARKAKLNDLKAHKCTTQYKRTKLMLRCLGFNYSYRLQPFFSFFFYFRSTRTYEQFFNRVLLHHQHTKRAHTHTRTARMAYTALAHIYALRTNEETNERMIKTHMKTFRFCTCTCTGRIENKCCRYFASSVVLCSVQFGLSLHIFASESCMPLTLRSHVTTLRCFGGISNVYTRKLQQL